jgi:ParB family transcriptional regulator, chromosome partitioning protein
MLKLSRANEKSHNRTRIDKSMDSYLDVIPTRYIKPNPYQPRKVFTENSLNELTASIKEYGLLQPINIRRVSHNYYELIAGERRLRAVKRAGFTHIKAIVKDAVNNDSAMIAMIENLQRENLHFFEEAEGYVSLIKEHGFTQDELAKKLGKNQSTIANKIRILRLPKHIKEQAARSGITERHARALLRLHNEQAQKEVLDLINAKNICVKETEDIVERKLKKLYGEVDMPKIVCINRNKKIYINTIKKAFIKITDTGADGQIDIQENEQDVCISIRLKI